MVKIKQSGKVDFGGEDLKIFNLRDTYSLRKIFWRFFLSQ